MATKAIVGEKVGMTQVWGDDNRVIPVTVLKVAPARDRAGQDHRARRLHRPPGHLRPQGRPEAHQARGRPLRQGRRRAGHQPGRAAPRRRRRLSRSARRSRSTCSPSRRAVDVTAVSRGKGFAGVMKRHNFSGQRRQPRQPQACTARPARSAPCALPGRVFKGTKMAGRMGGEQVTTLNLEVVEADAERDLLLVKGSVPGPKGGVVIVRNAVKAGRRRSESWQRSPCKTAAGADAGSVELDDDVFGIAAQRARDAPGRHGPARHPPGRHAEHQDPRRGPRRRREAVQQKGTGNARQGSTRAPHWTRRRRRPRPQAPQLRPAHPEEDDPPRAALGAVAIGPPRARSLVVDELGLRRPEDAKRRQGRARRARRRGQGPRGASTRRRRRTPIAELPQPARGAALERRRAQRLRRALQRLDRLHARPPCRAPRPSGCRAASTQSTKPTSRRPTK